ncbi:MAG: hypothetical protein WCI11_09635 [Candidatus Methylumidiphilus sp.]
MPESSHRDVNLRAGNSPDSNTCTSGKLPSLKPWIPASLTGMTTFSRSLGLCI